MLWGHVSESHRYHAAAGGFAAFTLQQIASSGTSGPSPGSSGSSFGSSDSPLFYPTPPHIPVAGTGSGQVGGHSTDESEGAGRHSSDELFQSKKKNSKSSSAHSYCHVSMK